VINVTTYSPSLDQYETDANSQYSFAVDFDVRFGPTVVWLSSPGTTEVATDHADVHATINQDAAVVKVVWDTVDHGTGSTTNWPNVQDLPAWTGGGGQLTATLPSLSNGTSYVFRFFAANPAVPEEGWSTLGAFTTPLTVPPPVMGTPTAHSIIDTSATTQCQLTQANGEVTLVWASADQGATTIAAWTGAAGGGSHSFGAALQDDVLSHTITGLDPESTYFFRFFATNAYGTDWSEAASFTTVEVVEGGTMISTFDSDHESWTNGGTEGAVISQVGTGGNPDGYLQIASVQASTKLVAPSAFLGDLSAHDGGTFSWDGVAISEGNGGTLPGSYAYGKITVTGTAGSATHPGIPSANRPTVAGGWTGFSLDFTAADFGETQVNWDAILADWGV